MTPLLLHICIAILRKVGSVHYSCTKINYADLSDCILSVKCLHLQHCNTMVFPTGNILSLHRIVTENHDVVDMLVRVISRI